MPRKKKVKVKEQVKEEEISFLHRFVRSGSLALSSLILSAMILFGCIYFYLSWRLPDVAQLKDVHLQVPLRVYTSDGKLLGEFGEKRRIPVTIDKVPKDLINAVLDTEDQRFYDHPGVDFIGLVRAAKTVFATGRKSQGASTITMQVARNFFLTNDKTYTRKLNEIMLALKIDQKFSKKEVLELYLNEIYLGQRSYGMAAASQVYYGKNLQDLTVAEMAMLAGLPQAPSRANPIANVESALDRRNHVLERMYDSGHINYATYRAAIAAPNTASYHESVAEVQAPYVAEMARQNMVQQFGEDVCDLGYSVYTTIDSHLQESANRSLRNGILAYEKRHGYRGEETNLGAPRKENMRDWRKKLQSLQILNGLLPAAVIARNDSTITALLGNGSVVTMLRDKVRYTSSVINLQLGDVIRLQKNADGEWELSQVPQVEGALVALNPWDGAVLSLVGGFSYNKSSFNRAVQADNPAGSAFKPFIYSAALEKGFTLASVVNDAPIVVSDVPGNLWRPQNDNQRFNGPTRLREGLVKSRNLVSIRLLQSIGLSYARDYVQRFGFTPNELSPGLSLALGATSISPMQLTAGYATFANGGYKITPYFIKTVKDQDGQVVFSTKVKTAPESAERAISPQNAYLMTDALKNVILSGTATSARILNRSDVAGKTGTTNEERDAWFCGFNGDIVTGVWIGYDRPQSLNEHGGDVALPVWTGFMGEALKDKPEHSMPEPEGIVHMLIDPHTGLKASPNQHNAIVEKFMRDTTPKASVPVSEPSPYNDSDQGSTDVFNSGPANDDNAGVPKAQAPNPPLPAISTPKAVPTPALTKPNLSSMATVEEIEQKVLNAKPKSAMPPKPAAAVPKTPVSSSDSEPLF